MGLLLRRLMPFCIILFAAMSAVGQSWYSKGDLTFNTPSNWNSLTTGLGTDASAFTSGQTYIVQSGHTMTLNADFNTAGVNITVQNGGTINFGGFFAIQSAVGTFTINGTGDGGIGALFNSGGTGVTITKSIVLGSASTIRANAGPLYFDVASGNSFSGNTFGLTFTGSGSIWVYDPIATTTGTVTKEGSGELFLYGTNTYSGVTTINAGTLRVGNTAALGTSAGGVTVANGATLDLNGTAYAATEALTINGAGVSSGGALINSSGTAASWAGTVALASNASVGCVGDLTISGAISGTTRTFTKLGNGTIILTGTNSSFITNSRWVISEGTLSFTSFQNNINLQAITLGSLTTTGKLLYTGAGGLATATSYSVDAGGGIIELNSAGNLPMSSNCVLSGTLTMICSNAGNLTLSGNLSGAGGIIVNSSGTGVAILSGASSSYSGATTVNAGILRIGSATALGATGTGTTVASGGVLDLNGIAYAGENLTLNGTGVSSGGALINSSATAASWGGGIAMASDASVGGSGDMTISGIISGGFAATKVGAGILTLSNANTYSGGTVLSVGRLNIDNDAALGTGTFTINGGTVGASTSARAITNALSIGASFTFAGNQNLTQTVGGITLTTSPVITVSANVLSLGGVISGAFNLTKAGAGSMTLAGPNTYTGSTTISAGTLTLGAAGVIPDGSAVTVASGATLAMAGNNETVGSIAGAGTISSTSVATLTCGGDNSSTTFSGLIGTGAINLTKVGTGELILSGTTNSYTGVTTINAGILSVPTIRNGGVAGSIGQATNAASNIVIAGGTLRYTGATASTDRAITVNASTTGTIDVTTNTLTVSGSIQGAGNLTKSGAGTLVLSGANAYTGNTTVSAGVLQLAIASERISNSSNLILNGGTFSTGATTGFGETMGTLSVTANSTIALGTGAHDLTFSGSSASWSGGITITGWTGTAGEAGSQGRIVVGTVLTPAQLAVISFQGYGGATQLGTGEVVPVAIYYSLAGQTDANNLSFWKSNANGTGPSPSAFTGDGMTFIIQAGHSYSTTAPWDITGSSTLRVDGTLTLATGFGLRLGTASSKIGNLIVNGTMQANAQHVIDHASGSFTINSGGRYVLNHATANNGTTTFKGVETFALGSTFEYQNLQATGFTSGITYHHLILNAPITQTLGASTTVNGNLTVSAGIISINQNLTTIGGDLIINGGTLYFNDGIASILTLSIGGNVLISSGRFDNVGPSTSASGTSPGPAASITVAGNFIVNGTGVYNNNTTNSTSSFRGNLVVTGNLWVGNESAPGGATGGTFNVTNSPALANNIERVTINGKVTIDGGTLNLNAQSSTDASSNTGVLLVQSDVELKSGSVTTAKNGASESDGIYFDGSGTQNFIHSGGALSVASGGAGRRFYFKTTSGPTINETYSGTTAQTTVNGTEGTPLAGYSPWPSTITSTSTNNLSVSNPAGVTMSTPRTVAGTVTLSNGAYLTTTTTNLLTVTNTATSAVFSSSSSYVDGPLRWNLASAAATYIFPVGKSTGTNPGYYPFTLTSSSATSPVVEIEAVNSNTAGAVCAGGGLTAVPTSEYWRADLISGSFTGSVSLAKPGALGSADAIAQSTNTVNGDYFSILGSVGTSSINNSKSISVLGFFRMGTKSATCNNPANAGTIAAPTNYDITTVCLGVFDPSIMTSTTSASTSCFVEYQWQSSTNGSTWSDIAGATAAEYDASNIYQTTYFKRLARSICKTDWVGAAGTASIQLDVATGLQAGGTIAGTQRGCSSFDPVKLTNVAEASPCAAEYMWQSSLDGSNWTDILNTNNLEYDPGAISATTRFRRVARLSGALNWNNVVISNVITLTISNTFSITTNPGPDTVYMATGTAGFTVGTNITGGNVTYQWQVDKNDGNGFVNISNITGLYFGANAADLYVSNPTYSMNNYLYRCIVSSPGCTSVTSNAGRLFVLPYSIVSGSTTYACDGWNASVDIDIPVSSVGTLNLTTNVLRQINLKLGNSSCRKDLSSYSFWVIAPDGTSYKFINGFTGVSTNMWVDIKFRDHPALEKISEYSTSTVQPSYFPFSIGYYAVEDDDIFAPTFNGKVADGTWKIRIAETNASNGIAIEKAELVFGPPLKEVDVTGLTANNSCALATCLGADGNIIIGTNNGYSQGDPNYPGDNVNGCAWNQANNNSAWFYFFASSSTAYITVSGLRAAGNTSADMQLLVLNGASGCVTEASGLWTVPTGGCPDNESVNNMIYRSTNGGGITNSGNIYTNGITPNTEFNLTGLTPGSRYLLLVDGNGGATSSYYIEATTGAQNCIMNGILSVRFSSFTAKLKNQQTDLWWQTSSEINNQYFQIERSGDAINWQIIHTQEGASVRSETIKSYKTVDKQPLKGINYYRVKQVNTDGSFSYSDIRTVNNITNKDLSLFPNPGKGIFTLSGLDNNSSHQIRVVNVTGKLIRSANTSSDLYRFDMDDAAPGVYFIQVDGKQHLRFVKLQ